ncbi:MAG: hypothetical protein ACYC5I_05145, partial [Coriobacteriia bacterium]
MFSPDDQLVFGAMQLEPMLYLVAIIPGAFLWGLTMVVASRGKSRDAAVGRSRTSASPSRNRESMIRGLVLMRWWVAALLPAMLMLPVLLVQSFAVGDGVADGVVGSLIAGLVLDLVLLVLRSIALNQEVVRS